MTYFVMNDQSTLPIYMPFGSGNTTGLGALSPGGGSAGVGGNNKF